jgi:hypothetical protein
VLSTDTSQHFRDVLLRTKGGLASNGTALYHGRARRELFCLLIKTVFNTFFQSFTAHREVQKSAREDIQSV